MKNLMIRKINYEESDLCLPEKAMEQSAQINELTSASLPSKKIQLLSTSSKKKYSKHRKR